jgi:hypothetical protein
MLENLTRHYHAEVQNRDGFTAQFQKVSARSGNLGAGHWKLNQFAGNLGTAAIVKQH